MLEAAGARKTEFEMQRRTWKEKLRGQHAEFMKKNKKQPLSNQDRNSCVRGRNAKARMCGTQSTAIRRTTFGCRVAAVIAT
jgi:hypothetical protein